MLNYAERYIIFITRFDIKVYDTTTNLLTSPYVKNHKLDGSFCVAGTSVYCYVNPGIQDEFNRLFEINAQMLVEDKCSKSSSRSAPFFHYWFKVELKGVDVLGMEYYALMAAPSSSELIILGGKTYEYK